MQKISVIMGIYNCEKTLPQAIESILTQTYPDWELVMCDDGSTDRTFQVAASYRDRYPDRMILLRNEENRRLSYTLNRCLQAAHGELIARMDGDDRCAPERLEKQVSFLQEHPELDLVGTGMRYFGDDGDHSVLLHPVERPTKETLKKEIPFFHATILTYASVYARLGGYTDLPRVERVEDIDLWFRFYHMGFSGMNMNEALYFVREDENAIRRRTVRGRYHEYLAWKNGYRLLGFSPLLAVRPLVKLAAKALIPASGMKRIRKWQKRIGKGA